jgi:hypothetical protein
MGSGGSASRKPGSADGGAAAPSPTRSCGPGAPSTPRLHFRPAADGELSALASSTDSEEDDVTRTLNQNRISILPHWT